MEKINLNDYECSICFLVNVEPVKLPCNHYFCLPCSYQFQQEKMKCPICRKEIPYDFENKINKKKQKEIKKIIPEDFDELLKKSQKQCKEERNKIPIIIEYGNTHEEIEKDGHNKHKWQLEIRIKSNNYDPSLFIQRAKYKNHPTFGQMDCQFDKNLKSRKYFGWGVFDIPISIKWKVWMEQEDTELNHELSFQEENNFKIYKFYVDKNKLQEQQSKHKLIIKFQ